MKTIRSVAFIVGIVFMLAASAAAQTPISSGETLSGVIEPDGDEDVYTFTGSAGDTVIVEVARTSGEFEPGLDLIDPSQNVETYVHSLLFGTRVVLEDYKLLMSGTYSIVVSDSFSDGSNTGGYNITLMKIPGSLNSPVDPDGGEIASGETKTGGLGVYGDRDGFQIAGAAGDTVILELARTSGEFEPGLDLYDPDGNLETFVHSVFLGARVVLEDYKLLMSGTYTVVVNDSYTDGPDTGGYNLTFMKIPGSLSSTADANGGAIVSGETKSGALGAYGDRDGFVFAGCVDEVVSVDVMKILGGFEPGLDLYDPDGNLETFVHTALFGNRAHLEDYSLLMSGTYTVIILDSYTDAPDTGNYTISLDKVPSPPSCCDEDADGYDSFACPGGDDCDDSDPDTYPGAPEVCGDYIDRDCDGTDGSPEVCDNATDDDCDGLVDGADPDCSPPYPATANAEASTFGHGSFLGSGVFNMLTLLIIPLGAVFLLKVIRRRK